MDPQYRYYVIDDIIIYEVNEHIIRNKENTSSTKLLTTASACLTTLLNGKGEVVSRKALMYAGWEQHGFIVSTNTLNQNVLLIRKAIAKISEKEIIKTIFRQGISIPKGINIIGFNDNTALEAYLNSHNQRQPADSKHTDKQDTPLPTETERETNPVFVVETAQPCTAEQNAPPVESKHITSSMRADSKEARVAATILPRKVNNRRKAESLTIISLLTLVAIMISVMLFRYYDQQEQYYLPFKNYQPITPLEGFSVYIDSSKCQKDYALNFLRQHLADFSEDKRKAIYFSCERNIHRASALLCNKSVISPEASCKSYYFL